MTDYNEAGALELLEELAGWTDGFEHVDNPQFSFLDGIVLYSLLRHRVVGTVVEIGSGYSTRIIRAANATARLTCVDPDPRADITGIPDVWFRCPAQEVDPADLVADVLFVDSSHLVMQGSELPFLFFDVLPQLGSGALVHFHDVFFPDDYPPSWAPRHYGEQYLLRAYLEHNPEFRVLYPGYLIATRHSGALDAAFGETSSAGSFWIEKV